ncbi:hypothetical protein ACSBR2_029252 [Camellia fascicularis]
MYAGSEQLAKLSSTIMMYIVIGNFMSSLRPMNDKDILTNITALGILIITVIEILVQHVLVNFFMFLLFLLSTFSAVIVATTKKYLELEKCQQVLDDGRNWEPRVCDGTFCDLMCFKGDLSYDCSNFSTSGVMSAGYCYNLEIRLWGSITLIFVIQTATVGLGIIGPVCRWFTAIKFKCSKESTKGFKTELKLESSWIKSDKVPSLDSQEPPNC